MTDHRTSSVSVDARKKSVAEEPVTSVLRADQVPISDRELDADEEVLASLGYNYALAAMILAAVSINDPSFVPENYQIALIITIITIPAATNRESQGLPRFTPSSVVWGDFYEGTDFPNGVAMLMSFIAGKFVLAGWLKKISLTLLSVIWTMSGYDAPFHLSEECSNANIASPRAIVLTSGVGGIMGWALQLVAAYTIVSIDDALNSDLGQPWAAYLLQVLPKNTALALLGLTIICGFSMGQGCMVAASRVTFAYSRDDCFPLSRYWARVNRHTRTPVNAVWLNAAVGILLTLLVFGGPYAIGAIFSIGAIAAFVAFTIPITIRTFFVGNRFRPGPWHLGRFSPVIGTAATCFTALMIPILCLPSVTGKDLTPSLMNWTCLVWGAPMLAVLIWWVVDAHRWFKGPKVNVEHLARVEGRVEISKGKVVGGEDSSGKEEEENFGSVKV
ncbi:MAG: hypothetical protein Q9227_003603 [Pyrenula ochraceoflavens]